MKPLGLIVCVSQNNIIGANGKLPWSLPEDMKRFKAITTGHPIIMGRKTWESIGRPLPNRLNIVVSTNAMSMQFQAGVHGCLTLDIAIGVAEFGYPGKMPIVIGGSKLYEAAIPKATKLYITTYEKHVDGDTSFPFLNFDHWQVDHQERLGEFQLFTELSRRPSSLLDL